MNDFLMESGFAVSAVMAIVLLAAMITFAIFSGKLEWFKNKKAQSSEEISTTLIKGLKRFASLRDCEILGRTTLRFGSETFDFDAILLTYYGTFAVKSCFEQGEIYGEAKDEKWVSIDKNGKREYFANPMSSANGSVKFFKELYGAEKAKCGMSEAVVVFPAKNAELFTGKNTNVYTLKTLEAKLSTDKYQADKGADIPAMKAALEKYTVK
ncbi:MAG: NERD domain-containing protein [Oscillospiraceae bacterium]|nr:NERD domain-containing protein [Oscillospiraceae bacterium]